VVLLPSRRDAGVLLMRELAPPEANIGFRTHDEADIGESDDLIPRPRLLQILDWEPEGGASLRSQWWGLIPPELTFPLNNPPGDFLAPGCGGAVAPRIDDAGGVVLPSPPEITFPSPPDLSGMTGGEAPRPEGGPVFLRDLSPFFTAPLI